MTEQPLFGHDLLGDPVIPAKQGILANRYIVPPFDVLDGRAGAWKERKAMWNAIPGFDSSAGRMGAESWNGTALANGLGQWLEKVDNVDARTDFAHGRRQHRVSVFDPVLAECIVSWFTRPGDLVVDPFSGGSVRGVVSAMLGRQYIGVDLSAEQCEENRRQAQAMGIDNCSWINADAFEWVETCEELGVADLVFTCPPYGTLERYSDDARDLSTMAWPEFKRVMGAVLHSCRMAMKPNAWIAIAAADYREKAKGRYTALRPFVSEVTRELSTGPLELHASCVYLTPLGTLPVRAAHNFRAAKKLGRAHQNIVIARREGGA